MYISNCSNIILIGLGNREQTALVLVLVLYVICFIITMMSAWEKQYSPSGSVPLSAERLLHAYDSILTRNVANSRGCILQESLSQGCLGLKEDMLKVILLLMIASSLLMILVLSLSGTLILFSLFTRKATRCHHNY
jgi:hypothetical protein